MTVLGGAGVGPECPSGEWTPERGTGREWARCPGGRVVVDGLVSSLVVVVTRWHEHPQDAYAQVTLEPPTGSDGTWRAAIQAQLAALPNVFGEGLLAQPAPAPGTPVSTSIRAYLAPEAEPPSLSLRRPPRRALRR